MLEVEEGFLGFDFSAKFFLGGEVEFVFAGKELLVAVQDGIAGNVIIRFRTKNDADGGVVALSSLEFIIHPHIHIHLSDVLMSHAGCFQVDEAETLEDIIVEDEVDVVVLFLSVDVLLAGDESEALAEFHHELLQVGNNGALKGILSKFAARLQTEKFGNNGVLDEFEPVGDLRRSGGFQHFLFHKVFALGL